MGVPEEQAEQQSEILAEVLAKSVASQNDLTSLEYSLSSKIEKLDTSLTTKIEKLDLRIGGEVALVRGDINHVKWVLATLMAINIAVALKVFLH